MSPYSLERTVAIDAVRLAARLCLAIREEMYRKDEPMEKAGDEPVTTADYGAQALILQHIAGHFPDDALLAEERADDFIRLANAKQREHVAHHISRILERNVSAADTVRWLDSGRGQANARTWVVDPIDGTKGFLRGDQFAIAVALLVDGIPVAGALGCPLMPFGSSEADGPRGVIAAAVHGQGATLEPLSGGPVRAMRVSDCDTLAEARLVESVEVEHTDHAFSARLVEVARIGGSVVRIDSQAKYVAVADGRAEIYIRLPREGYHEKVWDHAAGVLIVEEAGGFVTDIRGNPMDFSCGKRLASNEGILATNGALHTELLTTIRAIRT